MAFPGSAPGAVAALDFFSGHVRAVMGLRKGDGPWRVLGSASAALEGVEDGVITHTSDAAETIASVIGSVSRSAGRKPEAVFYTLHDRQADFRCYRASRLLPGEGQIRPSDVRAVFSDAHRLAGSFETMNVYATQLGFVIDDQDPVTDPIGIFGRKIQIEAGFLQMRSTVLSAWKEVMLRAYLPSAWAVPVAQTLALGTASDFADGKRRVVISEYFGRAIVCRAAGSKLESCLTLPVRSVLDFLKSDEGATGDLVVAGENARHHAETLSAQLGVEVRIARPDAVEGLHAPEDTPTSGLFVLAQERERLRLTAQHGHGLARKARKKLTAFWNDYF